MRESGLKSILYGAAVSLLRREGSLKRFMGALKKFSRTLRCIVQKLLHLVFQFQSIQANAVHYLGHSINNISINYFIRKELLLAVTYYYWFLTIAFCDDHLSPKSILSPSRYSYSFQPNVKLGTLSLVT